METAAAVDVGVEVDTRRGDARPHRIPGGPRRPIAGMQDRCHLKGGSNKLTQNSVYFDFSVESVRESGRDVSCLI